MRLPFLCLAALLLMPTHLSGQVSVFTVEDSMTRRIKSGSCPLADSILGPASKAVLKADMYGFFRADSSYLLNSGPMKLRNEMPQELVIAAGTAGHDSIPTGYLTLFFPRKVMDADLQHAPPVALIVDDTVAIPLGLPIMPEIRGYAPSSVPVQVKLTTAAVRSLTRANKARVEFLRTRMFITRDNLTDMAATARVAICFRSGQGISRE